MFNLSKRSEYGLQLMVALAKNFKKGPLSLKAIAKTKKLPYRFLSQVVTDLKKAKLVESKEGVGGGYFLTKNPKKIQVAKVLEVLEGPIELVDCLKNGSSCPWAGVCGQKAMFEQVKGSLKDIMEAHSLADLVKD